MQASFGSIALTGRSAREGGFDYALSGVPANQPAERVRAPAVEMFARGNARNNVSFAVELEHADADACIVYMTKHKQALDLAGRLTLLLTFAAGVKVSLENAVITKCESRQIGVRSRFEYGFSGGLLT